MFVIALLMAAVPHEDAVSSGPPAPLLDFRPDSQARRSRQADWQRFRTDWGRWSVRWDPRNDTPRFLIAPGMALTNAERIIDDIAAMSQVPSDELTLSRTVTRGERTFMVWQRTWRGASVEGDEVLLIASHGRIAGIQVRLTPMRLSQTPRAGEVVFVDVEGQPWLTTRTEEGFHVVYLGRDGEEVHRYDTRMFDEVLVSHEERTVGDAIVTSPARNIAVQDDNGTVENTDDDGIHSRTGSITATLTGPELRVRDQSEEIRLSGTGDLLFEGGVDMPLSAGTVQHHFHVVWDWLKQRWPDHSWLDEQVTATVEVNGSCNAYYTNGTINFYPEKPPNCNNFGRIADVVYHEVGHGIHDYIRVAGTFAGDVSEGSADYISATILNDPVLAPYARPDGSFIREIETDRVYPDDLTGEVHNDGLIWASFMWNLREQWRTTYGEATGVEMADHILLGALELGPTLTDIYEAVLLADDNDGDPTNGTPHDCELVSLLNDHGIGPGTLGVLSFDHSPLGPQASATIAYPFTFDVTTWPADCSAFDADSVGLWFTTNPDAALEDGDLWQPAELTWSGDTWSGEIPRQPAGAEVRYYLTASSSDGTGSHTTHGGREDGLYTFRIGDRESLFCEGFEHGATGWSHGPGLPWDAGKKEVDDWVFGAPSGNPDNPASAFEGSTVAGTNLAGDYTPNNRSHLRGAVWTVSDPGPMFMLSYQRFLTVEDGFYDSAKIWLGEEELWANPASESGSEAHLVDTDWTLHDISLEGVSGDIQLSWSLQSDGGLQYGGWALDSVCLVQLADPEGHYRVPDLSASDEVGPVTITWTQPWVTPLSATLLVRNAGGWPSGPEDGVIIDVDLTPTPGEARTATDDDAAPGETFYYALFSAGADDEDWYTGLVEGENADIGGVEGEGDSGDAAEDTGTPPVAEPTGCGCGGGGMVGLSPLLMLLIAHRRRRTPGPTCLRSATSTPRASKPSRSRSASTSRRRIAS